MVIIKNVVPGTIKLKKYFGFQGYRFLGDSRKFVLIKCTLAMILKINYNYLVNMCSVSIN